MDAAVPQVGDRHAVRCEAGDRRGDEHADRPHARRLELDVGLRADVDARRPHGRRREAALERGPLLHVVEHRGPLDARHRADDVGELLLHGHPQEFLLGRPALPGAVPLERPPQAAAELPRERLGVHQGPHVGALPGAGHPHPAVLGAMIGQLGAVEGRLDDRQFGRGQRRAGQEFHLLAHGPVPQQPQGPAHRRDDDAAGDHLRRRDPRPAPPRPGKPICLHARPAFRKWRLVKNPRRRPPRRPRWGRPDITPRPTARRPAAAGS